MKHDIVVKALVRVKLDISHKIQRKKCEKKMIDIKV